MFSFNKEKWRAHLFVRPHCVLAFSWDTVAEVTRPRQAGLEPKI